MVEATGPIPLLTVLSRKLEEFLHEVDNNHLVWLREIEEEAKRMFTSGFNEEPELMPKTPSQKNRRKKKRVSAIRDENQDPNKRRLSRRRSSARHSIIKASLKFEAENPVLVEETVEARPKRMTRAAAAARAISTNCCEQVKEECTVPFEGRILHVEIKEEDRRSAELFEEGHMRHKKDAVEETRHISENKQSPKKTERRKDAVDTITFLVPETPQSAENVAGKDRSASKLKIAQSSTPKVSVDEVHEKEGKLLNTVELVVHHNAITEVPIVSDAEEKDLTPKGSKPNRRSLRRSLIVKQSKGRRNSLVERYSLASKRESMTRDALRKSMRRSFNKKSQQSSSSSGHISREPSLETTKEETEEEVAEKTSPDEISEIADLVEQVYKSPPHSLRCHSSAEIADSIPIVEQQEKNSSSKASPDCIANKQDSPNEETNSVQGPANEESQSARRKQSYKRAVNEIYESLNDEEKQRGEDCSPPRKKTPSPPCPSSKVIRPNLKTFLHTVQKNQLLMTPVSAGRGVVKSFIKRNTPVKIDTKEKEKQRLEMLKKKEEAEMLRKQKLEEEKKRRMEEARLKREDRMRKVLQARERVEKIEEEKKKKIENKFAQIDEKSEKVREERLAEEKAKKKVAAKKMEEAETRRRQEEESRKQKLLQLEEEERKHQEMLQRKKEEEEQEKQRKIAEAKKQAELRQAEIERERQREQQLAAEKEIERKKELERIKAEKERERQEKEKALQLQREMEKAAREEAAAREKERLQKEMEDRERKKLEEQRQATLERQRQEKLRMENERKLQESQERKAKEQQAKTASKDPLNVTVDVPTPSVCQSYQMTPKGCDPKPPKINHDNYGMDLNSDDSTDDEGAPRKPIPSWAEGKLLMQAINRQYYNPPDHQSYFGEVENPKLEEIFYKSKPRYNKRTSSAVWNSPPSLTNRDNFAYTLKKF